MTRPRIALIAGAGWKGGNIEVLLPEGTIPYRCPEVLFPLPDGNTVLSRMVTQLRRSGVGEIYVGVGNPDCYRTRQLEKTLTDRDLVPSGVPGDPAWTWDRVMQVKRLEVNVVPINNPLSAGSCLETMSILLSSLISGPQDAVIGLAGDYVFESIFLEELIEFATYPSVCWVLPVHDILFLNAYGARALMHHIRSYPCRSDGMSIMNGNMLWKEQDLLAQKGFEFWEPPDEMKEYAPWVGVASMAKDCVPKFAELGIKLIEWDAACMIAEADPVEDQ
jgi:hypothetical protein